MMLQWRVYTELLSLSSHPRGETMKPFINIVWAAVILVPLTSHAAESITRAQVIKELEQLEAAGYTPGVLTQAIGKMGRRLRPPSSRKGARQLHTDRICRVQHNRVIKKATRKRS